MTYGIALSGGGVRGVTHAGVLKALEEIGITISVLSGTSAGSIVGALYAYGYSPDKIFETIQMTGFYRSIRPAWTWAGLLSMDGLKNSLLKQIPENNFDALTKELHIAATDLINGAPEYFSSGELIPPILASCCVPGIFNPVEIDGSFLVDGGLMDNFPTKALKGRCDFIIGSHCNSIDAGFEKKNLKGIVERSLLLAISGNTAESKTLCNLLIEPPGVGKVSGFELSRAADVFEIGYEYTIKNFKKSDFQ